MSLRPIACLIYRRADKPHSRDRLGPGVLRVAKPPSPMRSLTGLAKNRRATARLFLRKDPPCRLKSPGGSESKSGRDSDARHPEEPQDVGTPSGISARYNRGYERD